MSASGSRDIIEQTRAQANTLKNTLRSLARKQEAASLLEKVFSGRNENTCINNMEEAIEAIETSTRLVENAGAEIKLLVETAQKLETIRSVPQAVRQAAKIIGLLDVVIPKLTPAFSSSCQVTSSEVLDSMQNLGSLLENLSTKNDLYYTQEVRKSLKSAAKILSKTTTFLNKESHFKFEYFCTKDREHNKEFLDAVGNMMDDLADLYTDLGEQASARKIRKQKDFIRTIMVTLILIFWSFSNVFFYSFRTRSMILVLSIWKALTARPQALLSVSPRLWKILQS